MTSYRHPRPSVPVSRQLEAVRARQAATEHHLDVLQNTLVAVASEAGISVGGPCHHCDRSLLLVRRDTLYCPVCRYRKLL